MEANEMARRLGDSDLRLPGDVAEVLAEGPSREERGHIHDSCLASLEERSEFLMPLGINGTVARHSFYEEKPVLLGEVNDDVRYFAMVVYRDT